MLEKMKRRIPDAQDEQLLADLLEDAGRMICAYTLRSEVPEALESARLELAVMLYNRMGMEGEKQHAEGSVSRSVEGLPEYIRRQMNPFRLAKAVGACD